MKIFERPTLVQGDQGRQIVWDVLLPLLSLTGSGLRELQHVVLGDGEQRRLVGEAHRLQVVHIVLQLTQADPQQPEGLAHVVKGWVRPAI